MNLKRKLTAFLAAAVMAVTGAIGALGTDFGTVTASAAETGVDYVSIHGRLKVSGNKIVDKNGDVFQLRGMSTHGIMWETYGDVLSYESLQVLRDDWKCNTIRIAMYTEEWGGYTTDSTYAAQAKAKIDTGVENAKKLGMYVIIDWHILSDGNPNTHKTEAQAFFKEMVNKYNSYDNVLYEICNEPNGSSVKWSGTNGIKSYCTDVVNTIRTAEKANTGKNSIVICGTGTWSQDIQDVVGNALTDKNCVYALHFYANTHTDWLRERVTTCSSSIPILVSEFGTCDSSGNGGFNKTETVKWLDTLDSLQIGYINWSLADKSETASAFKSGTNLKSIPAGESSLTDSGKLIRSEYRNRAPAETVTPATYNLTGTSNVAVRITAGNKTQGAAAGGTYTITGLANGTYTVTCYSMAGAQYVNRTYSVTIKNSNATLNIKLYVKGDVNGDGKITTADVGLVNAYVRGTKQLDSYQMLVADVNGDGKITTADAGKINGYIRGTVKSLY